jgi:hypothetical protein
VRVYRVLVVDRAVTPHIKRKRRISLWSVGVWVGRFVTWLLLCILQGKGKGGGAGGVAWIHGLIFLAHRQDDACFSMSYRSFIIYACWKLCVRGIHVGAPSSGTRDKAVQCCYVSSQQLRRDSRARPATQCYQSFCYQIQAECGRRMARDRVDIILRVVSLPTVSAAVDA